MQQYRVSGYTSKYTLFQDFWIVEAKSDEDAIEQVAVSFRKHYPEYVVEYARQELHATEFKQPKTEDAHNG